MIHTGLPDPDAARRVISEAVPEIGSRIARQALIHAEAVGQFLHRTRRRPSQQEARKLVKDIIGTSGSQGYDQFAWIEKMKTILRGFYPSGDPVTLDPGGIKEILRPALQTLEHELGPWGENSQPHDWHRVLSELQPCLTALAGSLPGTVLSPVLPEQRPPKFARLHETAVAESVAERLVALIDEGVQQHQAAQEDDWPGYSSPKSAFHRRCVDSLSPFLTTEISSRYEAATQGFWHIENLAADQRYPEYREVADGIHPHIHSSYIAITVNYLAEVLELMPDYAEASGQGKRRDPVTVYGNVGAIHSELTNSHLSVANTVTNIGAAVNAVADRGEVDIADALRALAEAVQLAPELAEDQRAELLDHVADVADAAAAPDEPRRLSRARAAIAMITSAAGASTQLAGAVNTWHQVAGQLFSP